MWGWVSGWCGGPGDQKEAELWAVAGPVAWRAERRGGPPGGRGAGTGVAGGMRREERREGEGEGGRGSVSIQRRMT